MKHATQMTRNGFVLLVQFVALVISGCGSSTDPKGSFSDDGNGKIASGPLSVIVLDDEALGRAIKRQWSAHSEQDVTIHDLSAREFVTAEERPTADAIIYPTGLLGELAEDKLIRPIPQHVVEHESVDWRDMLPLDRGAHVTWDKKIYALSFGSPSFVLFFRVDIFEALKLNLPTTWSEYEQTAKKLSDPAVLADLAPADDRAWSATVEPLAPGWASQVFLARAAAYVRHPSRYSTLFNYVSMEPLIDRKPYVQAMDELAAANLFGPENYSDLTPAAARRAIFKGHCAMAISWPVNDRDGNGGTGSAMKRYPISVAPLPGSTVTFNFSDDQWQKRKSKETHVPLLAVSGRLGSVLKDATNARGALNMLARLTSTELGTTVASQSKQTTMFRSSHVTRPEAWVNRALDSQAAQQYSLAFQKEQQGTIWLFSIRIPGRIQYLDALDDAIQRVMVDGQSSGESLKAAADRWREITESDGRTIESQRKAYEKSLGL